MHRVDVEVMLSEMTSHQLVRWNAYHQAKAERMKDEAKNQTPPTVIRK